MAAPRRGVILPGVAIIGALFDVLGIEHMRTSKGALREGVIYDLMGRLSHEDVRERTVNALIGRANMRALTRPSRAYRLGLALFRGEEGPSREDLRALTPERVEEAARRYLRSSPSATVVVR